MKKKEIGKLLELLNEYETPRSGIVFKSYDDYDGTFYGVDIDGETEIAWSDSMICSKRFGWIARLVEQDKIDRDKFEIEYIDNQTLNDVYIAGAKKDELLIMLLSISEQPIDLLISLLKDGK